MFLFIPRNKMIAFTSSLPVTASVLRIGHAIYQPVLRTKFPEKLVLQNIF